MFRLYRNIEAGEHFVIGGDGSQGGQDENFCQFLSKTKLDIPLVYQRRSVLYDMTSDIFPVLEWIHDKTGVPPTIAYERNNGGASEMQRLYSMNRHNKYNVFTMKTQGTMDGTEDTDKFGYDTNTATRPILVGELFTAIRDKVYRIYDQETLNQLKTFIVSKTGKPEAARGKRDDAVMSLAIAHQLNQLVTYSVPVSEMSFPDEELFEKGGFY